MSSKHDQIFLVLLSLAFATTTAFLFVPKIPLLSTFSFYLVIVMAVQSLQKTSFAMMLTGFTTLLSLFCFGQGGENSAVAIPILVLTLWGGAFLMHLHHERLKDNSSKINNRRDEINRLKTGLDKEISFYEMKKSDLTRRSTQRNQLVSAARALGSCLDPGDLQAKLIETAQTIFPGRLVEISVGQNNDPVDTIIIQKGQPVLVPTKSFQGNPLLAVPIKSQGSVAGILRVGGGPGPLFSPDDLRFLDILGNLASLSLENSSLFKQIQESALRDNLTGLWTHRAFQEHLESTLLEASRYGQSLSLILTDVDHFKSVNDTHGHQAGDTVLQGFAHVLSRHVRDVDMVARYGGEEFIILLLQTSHPEARQVAEAVRLDLETQRFGVGSSVIGITGSFGVATFPQDATSAQQLIRVADERLYAAKRAGRNQVKGKAA